MSVKKKRGLSVDDKRAAILSVYHEAKEPFNLKELESLATKKGVVTQTVKDVNQSLIDDSLVCMDKIGSANFFWSFPAKVYQDKLVAKGNLQRSLNTLTNQIEETDMRMKSEKASRCRTDRQAKIAQLNCLLAQEKELDKIIDENKLNDPEEICRIENRVREMVDSVNRWTDNIYSIKSFLKKKRGMSGKELDKFLNIDENFDYLNADEPVRKSTKR